MVESQAQRDARLRALATWHDEWSGRQIAAGADGSTPPGQMPDYNQHVPDLEADGAAMDEFHARAREIMGIE